MGKTVLSSNKTLLWTNPNSSTNFAATTISLSDLSDYNEVEIVWTFASTNPTIIGGICRIPIGFSAILSQVGGTNAYNSGTICNMTRICTVNNDNIYFGPGNLGQISAGYAAGYNNNIIPYKIYGIK